MAENCDKISLKLAELSIQKFNDIAVPNCLGLLKNHKSNIVKSVALSDWDKIRKEEINATRIVKQLKTILIEMDILRNRIQPDQLDKFDEMTRKSRENSIEAIREYLDLQLTSSNNSRQITQTNTYDEDSCETIEDSIIPQIQSDFQLNEHQLKSQQACLEEFENLQREVEDLYGLYKQLDETVMEQKEMVDVITENAEEVVINTGHGERNLRTALRYKKTLYPICGALLGSCIGGPVGFFVGLKAGGLAAVTCGVLGFTGGAVLKKQEDEQVKEPNITTLAEKKDE